VSARGEQPGDDGQESLDGFVAALVGVGDAHAELGRVGVEPVGEQDDRPSGVRVADRVLDGAQPALTDGGHRLTGLGMLSLGESRDGDDRAVEGGAAVDGGADEVLDHPFGSGDHASGVRLVHLHEPFDEAVDEGILAAEVVEQAALRHACGRRDGVEGRSALSLVDQELGKGVEDSFAGCSRLRHGSIVFASVSVACYCTGWTV